MTIFIQFPLLPLPQIFPAFRIIFCLSLNCFPQVCWFKCPPYFYCSIMPPTCRWSYRACVCPALPTPPFINWIDKLPWSCIALAWDGSPWKQQNRGWARRSSANFPRLWLGWAEVSPGALINNNHTHKSKRNSATVLLENEREKRTLVHVWADSKICGNESLCGDEFPFNAVTSVVLEV